MNGIGQITLAEYIEVLLENPTLDPGTFEELKQLGVISPQGKPQRRTGRRIGILLLAPLLLLCSAAGFGAGVAWDGKHSRETLPFHSAVELLQAPSPDPAQVMPAVGVIMINSIEAIKAAGRFASDSDECGRNVQAALLNIRDAADKNAKH